MVLMESSRRDLKIISNVCYLKSYQGAEILISSRSIRVLMESSRRDLKIISNVCYLKPYQGAEILISSRSLRVLMGAPYIGPPLGFPSTQGSESGLRQVPP